MFNENPPVKFPPIKPSAFILKQIGSNLAAAHHEDYRRQQQQQPQQPQQQHIISVNSVVHEQIIVRLLTSFSPPPPSSSPAVLCQLVNDRHRRFAPSQTQGRRRSEHDEHQLHIRGLPCHGPQLEVRSRLPGVFGGGGFFVIGGQTI